MNNIIKKMLRLPCECYECLRMLTTGLANVTNVYALLMNDANVLRNSEYLLIKDNAIYLSLLNHTDFFLIWSQGLHLSF